MTPSYTPRLRRLIHGGLRWLVLALGVAVVVGLATLALGGPPHSPVARAAGEGPAAESWPVASPIAPDGGLTTTTGPEQLGTSLGFVTPTWSSAALTLFENTAEDAVTTGLRTLYVVGRGHDVTPDLQLTKYGSAGGVAWSRLYDGPAHGFDYGTALAVRRGAIYTAGRRDPIGDDVGDVLLIRWDTAGNRVWTRSYDSGAHDYDAAVDVVVDVDGNVTVLGLSRKPGSEEDWVLVSYRPDGTRRYVRRYDGPAHLEDQPVSLVADSAGRLYATGSSLSASIDRDVIVLKYSQAGTRLWAKRYDGPAEGQDEASALHLRPGGGVYVAGRATNLGGDIDALLLTYTGAGTRSFTILDTGSGASDQGFLGLDVLSSGDIVCGGSDSASGTMDRYVAAYHADGLRYLSSALGTAGYNEWIDEVAVDRQGGVYLAGTWGTATGRQVATQRVCEGGSTWTCVWPSAPTTDHNVAAVTVNGVNAYVVGHDYEEADGFDQFVLGHVY